jgi:hypothetical protein
LASVDTAYLRGIGKFRKKAEQERQVSGEEDKLVILLDLYRVFSRDEQQVLLETA